MSLATTMEIYSKASDSDKVKILPDLIAKTKQRQTQLGRLAQTDPRGALRRVLPQKVRNIMPVEALILLEKKVEIQGKLEIIYEDSEDAKHKLRHFLITNTGLIELHLPKLIPKLQSGAELLAKGWMFNYDGQTQGSLIVDNTSEGLQLLDDNAVPENLYSLPDSIGEQPTLVLLLNFQDNPVQPWATDQVWEMVFGAANDFFLENSYGQTWLSGDVHGYYTLPIDSSCSAHEIENHAQQAARENGVDVNSYSRIFYIYPAVIDCEWATMGTVGGSPSRSWVNGSPDLHTFGHLFGHNMGLHHAGVLDCGSGIIGDSCSSIPSGDSFDIMGTSTDTGHFNLLNKELLGWLSPASGEIVTAEASGNYQLEPYETMPAGTPKGLKVLRGTDSITGKNLWYYIEYRQPFGFDSYLDTREEAGGVLIRLGTEDDAASSKLLDMEPASTSADFGDGFLISGSIYTDNNTGISISTNWTDGKGATVGVSYTGESCIPAIPKVSISPSASVWVPAGTRVSYKATVTNRDSKGCAPSDFNLTTEVPDGWIGDKARLNLAPGISGTVNLGITSSKSAIEGFYDLTFKTTNSGNGSLPQSAMAAYVVEPLPPPLPENNPPLSPPTVHETAVEAAPPMTDRTLAKSTSVNNINNPVGQNLTVTQISKNRQRTIHINNGIKIL